MLRTLRLILLPFSWLYGLVLAIRRKLYTWSYFKAYRAPIPVISVGNISTGGTGKTPVAAYILSYLSQHDIQAAYLSRGYGRQTKGYLRVDSSKGSSLQYGDEALQIAHQFPELPVAVCEKRTIGIQHLLLETDAQVIVLDDAFQHLAVARDFNLVVMDAQRLPDKDFILPAGNLRESRSTLRKADFFIINKLSHEAQRPAIEKRLARWGKEMAFCRPAFHDIRTFQGEVYTIKNSQSVHAFAGIGNPGYFFDQLREQGFQLQGVTAFPDHHDYQAREFVSMLAELGPETILLTTEKDYYRLKDADWLSQYDHFTWTYLPMYLKWWKGDVTLQANIHRVLQDFAI
ncbi:MAG: tetraacyldisaccharide 4'-kinase [Bacteroidota bacterium]